MRVRRALPVLCVLLAPPTARAQVTRFQPPQPPFGLFASGVLRGPADHPLLGTIGANQVAVDQDGDARPDAIYDLPASVRGDTQSPPRWSFEDRLSPAQRVLYTRRFRNTGAQPSPPPVCDNDPAGHEVFFHRLDAPPAMTLLGSACVRGPLSRQPAFYEPSPTALLRTATVVAAPDGPSQEVAWVDLANGGVGEDATNYAPNVSVTAEGVLVSPFGNAFYVRHRTGQLGQDPRYSIVDLCGDPRGGAVSTRTEPAGATGTRVEHRHDAGALFADVTFTLAGGAEETSSFALANCFGGQPPALRRLAVTVSGGGSVASNPAGIGCVTGTCQADFADGTAVQLLAFASAPGVVFTGWGGDCSGTQPATQVVMDADRACTATFGTVQLSVAKTADAATTVPGQTLTYTLSATNGGSAPATGVIVSDTVPAGTDFVAAPGGTLAGSVVTWPLGTLAPGASAQARLEVRPRCQVAQVTNGQYSVDADLVFPAAGPPLTTPVLSPTTSPVTVAVTTVPDRTPLRAGDRVTHTVTLTNTGPADRPYLRLVTHLGGAASLDALVDAGTGAFSFVPPTTLTWEGPLAAGASTSLVLTVRIDDCFQTTATSLNGGSPVFLYNFCSQQVGSGQPPGPFPLQRPVEARIRALNPGQTTPGTPLAGSAIVGRPGEPLDLQLTVTNQFAADQAGVAVNAFLPPGISAVSDPPFLAPTDAGAAWDAATATVSWSGTLPASATATVTFRVVIEAGARCWMNLAVVGTHGACGEIRTGARVFSVPAPPAGPYVVGVDVWEGLYLWEPGVDRNFREQFCVHAGEFHAGLGRTAGGDLWMMGLPSFRADLSLPGLEAFAPGFLDTPAMVFDAATDAAEDPTDGTLVVVGGRNAAGGVKRYDPLTAQVSDIGPLPSRAGRVVVEPDGTIAALAGDRIYRLDPASPQSPQVLTFAGYAGLGAFDRETDGDYVVLAVRASGGGFVEDLVELDPVTGAVTAMLTDLDAATGNVTVPHGPLAVAADGTIYLGRADGRELYRLDRSAAPPVVTALSTIGSVLHPATPGVFLTSIRDLVFVEGAPPAPAADLALAKTASPDPVAAGGLLAYAVTVSNLGPDTATEVAISDPLPQGVSFDAAGSHPSCAESGGTVTCDLGDVAAGQVVPVTVVVTVDPAVSGLLSNTATVGSTTSDPDGGNDSATAAVVVTPSPQPLADLALTKTAAPDPLVVGSDLTYTLTAANAGPNDATVVRVTDTLPALVRFDPAGSAPSCAEAGGTVTCDLGTVPVAGAATTTIAARPLFTADLGVSRLDVAPAHPVVLGESLVYTVEVTNHGPGDARGVRLATLASAFDDAGNAVGPPLDAVIGSAHPSRGTCTALGTRNGPPLACALGTLRPGETARVTIVATPNAATTAVGAPGTPLTNAAHVSAGGPGLPDLDPHAENDRRAVPAVVLPSSGADLALTRAEAQPSGPLVLGGVLTYDLEVANLGADDAADVRLYTLASGFDPGGAPVGPPLGVTVLSTTASQGTCADLGGGSGPVECQLGALARGRRVQVSVMARPNSATVSPGLAPAPLVSRSRVTTAGAIAGAIADPHAANDIAALSSVVLPAAGGADLGVTALAVVPTTPVVRGSDLAYALTVTNFGPEAAPDVVVFTMAGSFDADGRPTGPPLAAKLVSITPSQGACTDLGGGPIECQLGALAAGASAGVDLAISPDAATGGVGAPEDPLVNAVSVTTAAALGGNDLDPHAANDRSSVASTVLERLPDTLDNLATVQSGIADPDLANNAATVSTPIVTPVAEPAPVADLSVALSGPAQASLGVGATYVVALTNAGPDTAPGATVAVTLSAGLTLEAVSPSQGSCAGSPGVFCALGDLAGGADASVTVVVRPRAIDVQTLTAEGSAFGTSDPDPADNRATLPISVGGSPPAADLLLTKTADAERVRAGDGLRYEVTVINQGPGAATGVRVVDQLPAGVSFVLAAPSQGTCALEAGSSAVVCPLGTLLFGAQATISIVVAVSFTTPPGTVLVNWAGAVAEPSEPTPADNEDTASVTVDPPPPAPGENMDPAGAGEQFAYGENVGWINLEPLGAGGPGVEVRDDELRGWMWGENVGWCSLSCLQTATCAEVDYGVTNDGSGNLAGWGWCENAGWLSFSCANTGSCATAAYGVAVDPATGVFAGEAWGENVGWIRFSGAGAAPFRVVTGWRATP